MTIGRKRSSGAAAVMLLAFGVYGLLTRLPHTPLTPGPRGRSG